MPPRRSCNQTGNDVYLEFIKVASFHGAVAIGVEDRPSPVAAWGTGLMPVACLIAFFPLAL